MFNSKLNSLIAKKALMTPVRNQMIQNSKRSFSAGPAAMTFGQKAAMGIGGASIMGITYLSFMGHQMRRHATPEQQLSLFHPTVQKRIGNTMGYFTGACATTGFLMHALRNSKLVNMNPWLLLGLSLGTMFGTYMCDYQNNWALKNVMYGAFVGTMSLSLVPMIHMYEMKILYDALIATGVTMGSLGVVAYNAPSEQFLSWGGPLAVGLGGLLGVSLLQMLYPGSKALMNISLYGGLALFSAYVLYDTQKIMHNAKTLKVYDPINNSIGVYLDAINIFVRFAQILGGSKK